MKNFNGSFSTFNPAGAGNPEPLNLMKNYFL
jgi:hypothetical protein